MIDDDIYMERGKAPLDGVYEFKLSFKDTNSKNIDYFSFVINCDGNKSFEENGVEFKLDKCLLVTIDALKKKNFCEIHELFSDSPNIYIVKKDRIKNTLKKWLTIYSGTVRNQIITKQKTRI